LAWNVRTFPLRISSLRNPSESNFDLSALKNTRVKEGVHIQFRADFLDAFNHPWFAGPNTNVYGGSAFGQITAETGYDRRIQLGLKLIC
jgi:hypothetical protein